MFNLVKVEAFTLLALQFGFVVSLKSAIFNLYAIYVSIIQINFFFYAHFILRFNFFFFFEKRTKNIYFKINTKEKFVCKVYTIHSEKKIGNLIGVHTQMLLNEFSF